MNDTETIISATELLPFVTADHCECRSCGAYVNGWDRFCAWLRSTTPTRVELRFCSGGKPPTEQVGMLQAAMTGERESFNPCAGLTEPHLHVQCRVCGAGWLMRTKQAHQ